MVMQSISAKVVLIGAIASGQGKTTVTAALARKLVQAGQRVRVFKSGPDFIDPMLLERASGAPVFNLDLWMVGQEASQALLAQAAQQADVILIEGVMGLYDGTPSSADLARAFGVPVLAVLDAGAMAQTVGALALGLRDYGPVQLAGVIANRIASPGHARMVAEAMRDIALLGTLPRQQQALPERHLGLVLPQEVAQLDAILDALAAQLELDLDAWNAMPGCSFQILDEAMQPQPLAGKTIAVARDAAFAFIYPANLACLRALGAELAFFSPLADQAVPEQADALYLPGGYPELHLPALQAATRWQASMRALRAADLPVLAECGGMMVLADTLTDKDGTDWSMLGMLDGRIVMQERLAALGPQAWPGAHGELRGHTFHFSRFETGMTPQTHALRHGSGTVGEAIYRSGKLHASYFHAYFPSNPAATAALFS